MDEQDNVRRHRESLEAFNRRDLDAIVAVYADDVRSTDHARQETLKSAEGVRSWNQEWIDAFSDGEVTDLELIGAGPWTVARFVGRGTNDGPIAGMEPTDRRVEVPFCDIARWDDGRIVEQHFYYDLYGLLAQLGHVPPLGSAA